MSANNDWLKNGGALTIPPYQMPGNIGVRCLCLRYYIVFTGPADAPEQEAIKVKNTAAGMGAYFIDSRETPFTYCNCGEFLDFSFEDWQGSCLVQ